MRALVGWLRRRAARQGIRGGRGGGVAVIQRFGSALNLNVHIHALVVDGGLSSLLMNAIEWGGGLDPSRTVRVPLS
jgi:Putative transposase